MVLFISVVIFGPIPGPLRGHMKVDVMDSAFATLHIGIIGFDLDLYKAELCMKGHIDYELNILKVSFIVTHLILSNVPFLYVCILISFIWCFGILAYKPHYNVWIHKCEPYYKRSVS